MIGGFALNRYHGKTVSHFENERGEKLDQVIMEEDLVVVFEDGDRLTIKPDPRGQDCYLSQHVNQGENTGKLGGFRTK